MATQLADQLAKATDLSKADPRAAVPVLKDIIFGNDLSDAETSKAKEQAIQALTDAYVKLQEAKLLSDLLPQLRSYFAGIAKAKTAKIVRTIVDQIAKIPNTTQLQVCGVHCSFCYNNFAVCCWYAYCHTHWRCVVGVCVARRKQ